MWRMWPREQDQRTGPSGHGYIGKRRGVTDEEFFE
jgi:hypothetical protein